MIYEINAHLKTKRRRKIMKKKLVSMILCVAMVATMAVGCGSGAKKAAAATMTRWQMQRQKFPMRL